MTLSSIQRFECEMTSIENTTLEGQGRCGDYVTQPVSQLWPSVPDRHLWLATLSLTYFTTNKPNARHSRHTSAHLHCAARVLRI
ncbi:hypothetical protein J6590_044613 [Homalodisca vitripennis]|nr:hypothetical protein J6590_044613 [Homalodisca vitripennis]